MTLFIGDGRDVESAGVVLTPVRDRVHSTETTVTDRSSTHTLKEFVMTETAFGDKTYTCR